MNSNTKTEKLSAPEQKKSALKEVLSFIQTIVICIILAILIKGILIEAFKIPSGSMKPTLMIGDHILVTKVNYGLRLPFFTNTIFQWAKPKRGEVVVFTRPDEPETSENEEDMNIIKRVLAIEGDTIEVRGARVILNGQELKEDYQVWWEEGGIVDFGPATVPAGHIFLMGDNRDHSKDSRLWTPSHFLPIERVKGKAILIHWSFDSLSRIGTIIR
jgi:signal peptidase I